MNNFRDIFNASPDELKDIVRQQWKVKQNLTHHPEGNTLKHIITVTNRAFKNYPDNIDIIMAAYFHDLGKLETYAISPKTGKPTAHGHEKVSVELIHRFSSFVEEMGADVEIVDYIVGNHMKMKPHVWDVMREKKKKKITDNPKFSDLENLSKIDRGGLHMNERWDWVNDTLSSINDILDNPHIYVVIEILENHMNRDDIDVRNIEMEGYGSMTKYVYESDDNVYSYIVGDDSELGEEFKDVAQNEMDNNSIEDMVSNPEEYIDYEGGVWFENWVDNWVENLDGDELEDVADDFQVELPEDYESGDEMPEDILEELKDSKLEEIENGMAEDPFSYSWDTFSESVESLEGSGVSIDWDGIEETLVDGYWYEPQYAIGGIDYDEIKSKGDGNMYHIFEIDW
jgi:hypothetical protein